MSIRRKISRNPLHAQQIARDASVTDLIEWDIGIDAVDKARMSIEMVRDGLAQVTIAQGDKSQASVAAVAAIAGLAKELEKLKTAIGYVRKGVARYELVLPEPSDVLRGRIQQLVPQASLVLVRACAFVRATAGPIDPATENEVETSERTLLELGDSMTELCLGLSEMADLVNDAAGFKMIDFGPNSPSARAKMPLN